MEGFELDKKLLTTLVVFVVVVVILWMLYAKFSGNSKPAGALTQAEYDALSATDKALYTKKMDGYFYKA